MHEIILKLAMSLPGVAMYTPYTAVYEAVNDVVEVANDEPPIFKGPLLIAKQRTAKLLLVWSHFESAWRTSAIGDGGQSCGVMQVNRMHLGGTCASVTKDRRVAYRAGLRIIRMGLEKCGGDLRAALGWYATGKGCGYGRMFLVSRRCTLAGGCT